MSNVMSKSHGGRHRGVGVAIARSMNMHEVRGQR